jgi:hypothetical protein
MKSITVFLLTVLIYSAINLGLDAVALSSLLFIGYYFMNKGELFRETFTNQKGKECSQKAINDAYNFWIFGSPKFVR